jgi:hypothetical protein
MSFLPGLKTVANLINQGVAAAAPKININIGGGNDQTSGENYGHEGRGHSRHHGGGHGRDIDGSCRSDCLRDSRGDDNIHAGRGNDYIDARGGGDDKIDGGRGFDTVRLEGDKRDYRFHTNRNGDTVAINKETGDRTVLRDVEKLVFDHGSKRI